MFTADKAIYSPVACSSSYSRRSDWSVPMQRLGGWMSTKSKSDRWALVDMSYLDTHGINWDLSQCPNPQRLVADKRWGRTQGLIYATVYMGLSEVSRQCLDEWTWRIGYARRKRLTFYESFTYHFNSLSSKAGVLTALRPYFGLTTNALGLSRDQWVKDITKFDRPDETVEDNWLNRPLQKKMPIFKKKA